MRFRSWIAGSWHFEERVAAPRSRVTQLASIVTSTATTSCTKVMPAATGRWCGTMSTTPRAARCAFINAGNVAQGPKAKSLRIATREAAKSKNLGFSNASLELGCRPRLHGGGQGASIEAKGIAEHLGEQRADAAVRS